jgi:multiple sugar transport system ATP-binding protein
MKKVKLEGVSKSFGGGVVGVKDIDLRVEDGEFLTLLGPSGCGKTTLLRLIAGLERPDHGEIYIDDQWVTGLSPAQRDIAMVFQSYALYPHMTVYDNIAVGLKIRKFSKAEVDRQVKEVASLLEIREFLDRRPRALSGGQRQRVAVGRAIARRPKVFLLDEPLSNLDALLREQTRSELKLLFSKIKATVIYVTHDQTEAMTMSDRIALLHKGELQQVGIPEQVYYHPVNTFVAGFMGSPQMNLFEVCTLERGLKWEEHILPFPKELLQGRYQKLILGIRPEDICLYREPQAGSFKASMQLLEPLGPSTIVTLSYKRSRFKALTYNIQPSYSPHVWVKFKQEGYHLFDPETGKAIT